MSLPPGYQSVLRIRGKNASDVIFLTHAGDQQRLISLTCMNSLPNNENKHCRGKPCTVDKLSGNSPRFLRFFAVFFFRVGHEQVLYRGCLPQWKQEKTRPQLLLFPCEV